MLLELYKDAALVILGVLIGTAEEDLRTGWESNKGEFIGILLLACVISFFWLPIVVIGTLYGMLQGRVIRIRNTTVHFMSFDDPYTMKKRLGLYRFTPIDEEHALYKWELDFLFFMVLRNRTDKETLEGLVPHRGSK